MIKLFHFRILTFFIVLVVFFSNSIHAQTILVGPANGGNFELSGTNSLIANGWNNSLPATNRWYCGEFAVGNPTYSAYIRVNTSVTAHSYNTTTSSVGHFWRDITFPAGQSDINLQFDWINMGEAGFDQMKVFLVNTGTTPAFGTALTTGQIGLSEYSNNNTWKTSSVSIPQSWAGLTGRLVFSWENDDNTGTNPPAAVDNILVTSNVGTIIDMPTSGITSMNVCSAEFNNPGAPNNYGLNGPSVLTLCPSTAGTYLNIQFDQFQLESRKDYLFIYDGASTNDKLLAGYNGSTLPASVRASSNNPGGCLTFKFVSNNLSTSHFGWNARISCQAIAGAPPVYSNNRDCYSADLVCSDAALSGNNTGAGRNELFTSWIPCARTGEDEANWFYFQMATSGTIGMTIDPGPSVDYDFAIWGPYTALNCPVNTFDSPIRCSYSQLLGTTGMTGTAGDVSEDASGDKFIQNMNVNTGDLYIMYINNYSISSTAFNLSWQFTNGASLGCSALPVQIGMMSGERTDKGNLIKWVTFAEENSNTFEVQRSLDAQQFETIKTINAAGHSQNVINYNYLDGEFLNRGFYYRVKEVDFDGKETFSRIIYLDGKQNLNVTNVYPVPAKDILYADVTSKIKGEVIVEVINSIGDCIYYKNQQVETGVNSVEINTSDLATGVYFVRITNLADSFRTQKAFVK